MGFRSETPVIAGHPLSGRRLGTGIPDSHRRGLPPTRLAQLGKVCAGGGQVLGHPHPQRVPGGLKAHRLGTAG